MTESPDVLPVPAAPGSGHTAVVVGGGIAGLVMARELVLGGFEVTLLESSDRLGGKIAAHSVAGIELDAGAESFATRRGTVATLARQLGLERQVVRPDPAGAWLQGTDGAAHPLPATGMLGIPGVAMATDVIDVIGFRAAMRAQLDELMVGTIAAKERTLGAVVRRRMGPVVLEKLVAPVTVGIHSAHPDDLDLDRVAPGLRDAMLDTGSLSHGVRLLRANAPAGSAVSGLVGGIFEFVAAFERDFERFGVHVRLSTPVASVDAAGATLKSGERVEADRVVLATALSPAFGETLVAPSIVLATLVLDSPGLDAAPRGTGVLVAAGTPGIRAKALTHSTAKWQWLAERAGAHRHVVRLSYDPKMLGDSAELREVALADASRLFGIDIPEADLVGLDVVEWAAPAVGSASIGGVVTIGEGVAGTGLAAVVSHAKAEAGRLLEGVEP